MPFLQLATAHIATNHLSRIGALSSKIVPAFALNWSTKDTRNTNRSSFKRTLSSRGASPQRHREAALAAVAIQGPQHTAVALDCRGAKAPRNDGGAGAALRA